MAVPVLGCMAPGHTKQCARAWAHDPQPALLLSHILEMLMLSLRRTIVVAAVRPIDTTRTSYPNVLTAPAKGGKSMSASVWESLDELDVEEILAPIKQKEALAEEPSQVATPVDRCCMAVAVLLWCFARSGVLHAALTLSRLVRHAPASGLRALCAMGHKTSRQLGCAVAGTQDGLGCADVGAADVLHAAPASLSTAGRWGWHRRISVR